MYICREIPRPSRAELHNVLRKRNGPLAVWSAPMKHAPFVVSPVFLSQTLH